MPNRKDRDILERLKGQRDQLIKDKPHLEHKGQFIASELENLNDAIEEITRLRKRAPDSSSNSR